MGDTLAFLAFNKSDKYLPVLTFLKYNCKSVLVNHVFQNEYMF